MNPRFHPVAWLVAAGLMFIAAGALDRKTSVEIYSSGGRIEVRLAGTSISAPVTLSRLGAVEIAAMDSIQTPGGGEISVASDDGTVFREDLPRRFKFPETGRRPIGDWAIDDQAASGVVWSRPVRISGPFVLRADFRGRFHQDLSVLLHGRQVVEIAVRRGLINNDLFIRIGDGSTVAATSVDPTPLADLGAIAAVALRAVALCCALIGVFTWLAGLSVPRPTPAARRSLPASPAAFAVAAVAILISAWFSTSVLEGLPHVPDSVTYLLQARWLLGGDLVTTASAAAERMPVPYTYIIDGRWLGQYPPGWPAAIAVGLAFGAPELVSPLLGGLFIILLFLVGRELDGPILGLLAAALALVSPIARVVFGSYLSHAAAATAILTGLWLMLAARRRASWPAAAAAGAAMAVAFAMRPLTACAAALALTVFAILDVTSVRTRPASRQIAAAWIGGGIAFALPTLLANAIVTGSPWTFPYAFAGRAMYALDNIPFGIRNLDAQLYTAAHGLLGWDGLRLPSPLAAALTLALAAVPFLLRRHRPGDLLLAALVAAVAIAHLGSRGHGLHGFGPRYLFETFACLFLLCGRGFQELGRIGSLLGRTERAAPVLAASALFALLSLAAAAMLPTRLERYRGYNGVDGSLEHQIESAGVTRAVVALPVDHWQSWAMVSRRMDPQPGADLLFLEGPVDRELRRLAAGRPILEWDGTVLRRADVSRTAGGDASSVE